MNLIKALVLFAGLSLFVSCAHPGWETTTGQIDYDENSKARGAAYVSDVMHIRKPMPSRPDWKPLEFYFKHCSDTGDGTYYSKTSYECTPPY